MRTITFMMICGWLVASGTFLTYGDEEMLKQAKPKTSRTFNVLKYGAVGDDKTDNTEAFSACLKAVIEAGGGRTPASVTLHRLLLPLVPRHVPALCSGGKKERRRLVVAVVRG